MVFATPELLRSDFSVSLIGLRMQGVKAPFALLHADDFYVPHGELTAPQMVDTALAMLLPERRVTCAAIVAANEADAEEETPTETAPPELTGWLREKVGSLEDWASDS